MRTREVLLFALLLAIVFAFRGEVPGLAVEAHHSASAGSVHASARWRYDARSPYYSFLPTDVREFSSLHPQKVAAEVCGAMGGRLDFMQRRRPGSSTLGFNCSFHEPDLTITREFGELRRTAVRAE